MLLLSIPKKGLFKFEKDTQNKDKKARRSIKNHASKHELKTKYGKNRENIMIKNKP